VRRERLSLQHEQAVADVPIRFEGLAGEYLQVHWGEIRHFPFTQQQPVTRYFLACRLKYSRWTWLMFTHEMRQETLFRGLVAGFNALGFVPWVLVFDNMKTVTTGRDDQAQPVYLRYPVSPVGTISAPRRVSAKEGEVPHSWPTNAYPMSSMLRTELDSNYEFIS
jgi:transposase